MQYKDMLQRITAELAKHPDITYTFEHRKRHHAVRLYFGARSALIPFSGTTTGHRAVLNMIALLRRTIRSLKA